MSINSPFAPSYKPANLYARPFTPGGTVGRNNIRVEFAPPRPEPAKAQSGKHSFLKKLLYGGATVGIGVLALKHFSPQNYAKLAEVAGKYTPTQVGEFKNYLVTQAGNLKNNGLIESALSKAQPLTDGVKNIWRKLAG